MYEQIDVTDDGGITTITLNRPEKLNALAGHMRRDLAEALEAAGSDPLSCCGNHRRRPRLLFWR